MTRTARSAAIAALTALAAVAAIIAADFAAPAQAQSDDETSGRIVARRLSDGRTELGWQPRASAGWGERVLPRARYLPAAPTVGRWLRTSPVEVGGVEIGRIEARLRRDGGIELAFTPTGGERILPSSNYLPANARVDRWLNSTEIAISLTAPRYTAVSSSYGRTCVLHEDGEIECWGRNDYGQNDTLPGRFTAVSTSSGHTCVLHEDGEIECWGRNDDRKGNHAGQNDAPPGRFTAVSAGTLHTCGLRENGAIECWGWNEDGETNAPPGRFTAVSAGFRFTCAVRDDGTILCWGRNTVPRRYSNVESVYGGQTNAPDGRFTAVSARDYHACGLRESGEITCWGANENTEGSYTGQSAAPHGRFSAVSAGDHHTCAIRESGEIECWGDNRYGQTNAPSGLFSTISAGGHHTCGLRVTRELECWGHNNYGQTDVPEDLATPAEPAAAGCPEPTQLFRVTETTPVARRIVREERLDTTCQVDGLPRGAVRPADRYAFTLDKPSRVSVELWSAAFPARLFLTDANGAYFYRVGTEREGGTWLSLSESRAPDGDGDAIIDSASGMTPASLNRVRLDAGSYWLFAVSESGSRTGDYQLVVEYERIADSEPLDQRIAERFAPVLFFEQEEAFFPVPVERMIELSTLHYTVGGQAHELAPGPGISREYGLADLISHNGRDSYLDLEDDYRAVPGDRVVYARVVELHGADKGVLVQYWFFYLYNATGARPWSHEGDWEGIQLWFAGLGRDDLLNAAVPTQLGYAAHESGWVLTPSTNCRSVDDPFRPSVYVARNRHASYPEPGSGGALDKSFDGGDQFQGNGAVWTLPGRDVPDAEGDTEEYEIRIMPSVHQSWLTWQGKWGDKSGNDGPRGPAFKLHFWAPPVFNDHWSGGRFFSCPSASE